MRAIGTATRTTRVMAALAVTFASAAVVGTAPYVEAASAGSRTSPSAWRAWFLASNDEFRLARPPAEDSARTRSELRELLELKERRTAAVKRRIDRWNRVPAPVPWTEVALSMVQNHGLRPPFSSRALRYLHTGMYDAMVAASDSKIAYRSDSRPKPAALDRRVKPLLGGRSGSSYAPVQAAIAGAAEVILSYLFPYEPSATFTKLATRSVESRLFAGANYRSDVERARALGNSVGALVVSQARTDGIDNATPTYPRPAPGEARAYASNDGVQENQWQPAPPNFESPFAGPVGTWRPQLMSTPTQWLGDQVIPGPYAYGSPEFMDELLQVISVQENLTTEQTQQAHFWDDGPVTTSTPPGHWFEIALQEMQAYPLDTQEATRALALLGATLGDAAIAAFGSKYYWWSIRPISAVWRLCNPPDLHLCTQAEAESLAATDPARVPYFNQWYPIIDTPAFPSYPGGHGTFSGSAGRLLSYIFPASEGTLNELAEQAANSRLFGGIHFNSDNVDGLRLGRYIADLAIQRANNDGSGL